MSESENGTPIWCVVDGSSASGEVVQSIPVFADLEPHSGVIAQVSHGQRVKLLEHTPDMVKVQVVPTGEVGWLPTPCIHELRGYCMGALPAVSVALAVIMRPAFLVDLFGVSMLAGEMGRKELAARLARVGYAVQAAQQLLPYLVDDGGEWPVGDG